MNILIRTYGSHLMGMGHLYRTKKIVTFLKKSFNCNITIITKSPVEIKEIYQGLVNNIIELDKNISQEEELKKFIPINKNYYYLVVNDQLDTELEIAKELSRISKYAITFDDKGTGCKYFDKCINVLYPNTIKNSNEINSFNNLILDDYTIYQKNYKIKEKIKKIFINQGGADTWGAIPDLIREISNSDLKVEIVVVLGPAFEHYNKLATSIEKSNKNIIIYNKVDNIVKIASECDIAILGAGNTLFEVASIGVPVIACTREEKELLTISRLLEERLVISQNTIYKDRIIYQVNELSTNLNLREALSTRCIDTFTYSGLSNIFDFLQKVKK